MTSLDYGLDMPYEIQLEHTPDSTTHMTILAPQRSPGQPVTRHLLAPGVYMVSLAYNGSQAATLQHVGGGNTNTITVPTGTAGTPRTSAPIKISVQGTTEYLHVAAPTATGGTARATISVIPAPTFDEMAESAQGVSVLSEISNLKTTKADKSTLDARVPANTSLRLDTTVGTRIFSGTTMIYGDTGWRNITSLIISENPGVVASASGAGVFIRRTGNRVSLNVYQIGGVNVTSFIRINAAGTMPAGFGADGAPFAFLAVSPNGSTEAVGPVRVDRSGNMIFYGCAGKTLLNAEVSWTTGATWPATLPGLPA